MSIINNMPSRPGVDIDGIIQSYYVYAGENISAGSFVEFVNGVASQVTGGGNQYQITSSTTIYINACVINTNKVFIMYTISSQGYAKIININNNKITQGTEYSIPYSSGSITWWSCCTVETNKVFLVYQSTGGGGGAIIANVSGNTITFVGNGNAFYSSNVISNIRCDLFSTNKVLICFKWNSQNLPMAVVATITNDEITYDTVKTLTTSYYTTYTIACSLGWGKEFILYYNNKSGTTAGWYGQILTLSGSNLSYDTPTLISDSSLTQTSEINCCSINPNTVLLVIANYSMLININGYTITYNNVKYAYNNSATTSGIYPSCCLIESSKAVVIFNDPNNSWGSTAKITNIKGNIITYGDNFVYNTTRMGGGADLYPNPYCFLVTSGKIALYYYSNNSRNAYFQVLYASGDTVSKTTSYEKQVRNVTQVLCDGVSNTAGTGGTSTAHNQAVEVYVPKDQFQLIANGDFNDGTNNWIANYASVMTDATYGNYLACAWTYNSNISAAINNKYMTDGKTADKFYMCCNAKGYSTNTGQVCLYCCQEALNIDADNTWKFYSKCFTASSTILNIDNTRMAMYQFSATRAGNKLDVTNIRLYNLTQMFGSGNEPNKAWCDTHLGGDIS